MYAWCVCGGTMGASQIGGGGWGGREHGNGGGGGDQEPATTMKVKTKVQKGIHLTHDFGDNLHSPSKHMPRITNEVLLARPS